MLFYLEIETRTHCMKRSGDMASSPNVPWPEIFRKTTKVIMEWTLDSARSNVISLDTYGCKSTNLKQELIFSVATSARIKMQNTGDK